MVLCLKKNMFGSHYSLQLQFLEIYWPRSSAGNCTGFSFASLGVSQRPTFHWRTHEARVTLEPAISVEVHNYVKNMPFPRGIIGLFAFFCDAAARNEDFYKN